MAADSRAMAERRTNSPPASERAALVGLVPGSARRVDADQSLDELAGLAAAAGASVALRMLQDRPKPDPATFIGGGKVASLAAACAEAQVDVVIVDGELTPAQLRHLEERLDPSRFFRIHRSAIVNLDRVKEIEPFHHGDQVVVLANGAKLKLSRSRRETLETRLGRAL